MFALTNQTEKLADPIDRPFGQAGVAMVEFALSVWILFMLIFVGLDLIRFGYSTLTLHYVLSQSARYAVVGTLHDASGNLDQSTRNNSARRIAAIKRQTKNIAKGFGIQVNDANIVICKESQFPCTGVPDDPGGSNDFIQLSIQRVFYFIYGAIPYEQTISVLARNEPW